MNPKPALQHSSACQTDAGIMRAVNEDACLVLPDVGLWVVADGMGGHPQGGFASRLIVDTLSQTARHSRLSNLVNEVEDKLLQVHRALVERAAAMNTPVIGSTVAALVTDGQSGVCLWAGDSRVYLYRNGRLEQLTRDHSLVEELVRSGGLRREDAEAHPGANLISRAVGANRELHLESESVELHHGDMYMICSDGLYREVSQGEIAEHMGYGDCGTICKNLVSLARDHGGHDNITVVVIKFGAPEH